MESKTSLYALVEQVNDEKSFIEFINALCVDKTEDSEKEKVNPSSPWGSSHNGWENGSIEAFLDAASAWATASINGLPNIEKTENPWRRAAEIIHAGKFYE